MLLVATAAVLALVSGGDSEPPPPPTPAPTTFLTSRDELETSLGASIRKNWENEGASTSVTGVNCILQDKAVRQFTCLVEYYDETGHADKRFDAMVLVSEDGLDWIMSR